MINDHPNTFSDLTLLHIISHKKLFLPEIVNAVTTEWENREIGQLETKALIKTHDELLTLINSKIKNGESKSYIILHLDQLPIDSEIVINTLDFNPKKKDGSLKPAAGLFLLCFVEVLRNGIDNPMGMAFFLDWNYDTFIYSN